MNMFIIGLRFLSALTYTSELPDTSAKYENHRFMRVQYAGKIGFIAAGFGKEFFKGKAYADINLGYLPKHVNGIRILTISLKPSFDLFSFDIRKASAGIYLGTAINYSLGRKIYGQIPDFMPRDYYWPNAFHFNPFAGIRLGRERPEKGRIHFFTELGAVDYKIWFAAKNRHVSFFEILDLAAGVMIRLGPGKAEN